MGLAAMRTDTPAALHVHSPARLDQQRRGRGFGGAPPRQPAARGPLDAHSSPRSHERPPQAPRPPAPIGSLDASGHLAYALTLLIVRALVLFQHAA